MTLIFQRLGDDEVSVNTDKANSGRLSEFTLQGPPMYGDSFKINRKEARTLSDFDKKYEVRKPLLGD